LTESENEGENLYHFDKCYWNQYIIVKIRKSRVNLLQVFSFFVILSDIRNKVNRWDLDFVWQSHQLVSHFV